LLKGVVAMRSAGRLLVVVAVCAGSMLAGGPAAAQGVERIDGYDVQLRVEPSGELLVTETIDYDFGTAQDKHGIKRIIPVRRGYDDTRDRIYPVSVLDVSATEGTPGDYETTEEGSDLIVRIGDPDDTVTGRHGYTIVYRVQGALDGFADLDELYWTAIGTQWEVPIQHASVRVIAPADVSSATCYRGPFGSVQPCAGADTDGTTAVFEDTGLAPHEGMTVKVGFLAGAVPAPQTILEERWGLARAFALTPLSGGLLALVSVLALLAGWLLLRRGRDQRPAAPAGIAGLPDGVEYRPPENLPPALAGLLIHQQVRPVDITATIVDLSARGYLRIEDLDRYGPDWRLVRQREDTDESLLKYELLLFDYLFSRLSGSPRPAVTMSTLNTEFGDRYSRVEEALYDEAIRRGWFTDRPDRPYRNALWTGMLVTCAGAALTGIAAASTQLGLVPIPIFVLGLALVIGARWIPRRTATGSALRDRVLAFRDYLRTTAFANPPGAEAGTVAPYLAYAMVFDLTQQWRTALNPSAAAAGTAGTAYPGWSPWFADHTDDFTRTSSRALSGTTSSSSSSGGGSSGGGFSSGGFSSGGSSGGGGGGGGGKSW
jgi:uncharacterized membrane protein YgcG